MRVGNTPFKLAFTPRGNEDLKAAGIWLQNISEDAAQRFANAITDSLNNLCQNWADGFHPVNDEAASLYFARPVFQELVSATKKRQRRSNASTWRILYDVADADRDGLPDTLRVLAIRHSAARPLSVEVVEDHEE